ncbi:MAG: hypothetical protein LBF15_04795 [Candidatus Peribacteria bacterium]|nr:hypothetical protein [Candidatus Peribacteria bacterium]
MENSGNSQVCNIIKDNDIKQNCIKACFPTEVFAGTESMYTPEKDNECFNSFVSMWAKKELDVGICNHTNTDEFHYVCNT